MVYHLIELTLFFPVVTASVERAFFAINVIKADLQNKMGDEWMNDLLVIIIEREIFIRIDNEVILQRFRAIVTRGKNCHLLI